MKRQNTNTPLKWEGHSIDGLVCINQPIAIGIGIGHRDKTRYNCNTEMKKQICGF